MVKAVYGSKSKNKFMESFTNRRKNTKGKCIPFQTSFRKNVFVKHNSFMFDHSSLLQILNSRNTSVLVIDFRGAQGRVGDKYERQSSKLLWIFRNSKYNTSCPGQRNSFILVITHFMLFTLPTLEFVT